MEEEGRLWPSSPEKGAGRTVTFCSKTCERPRWCPLLTEAQSEAQRMQDLPWKRFDDTLGAMDNAVLQLLMPRISDTILDAQRRGVALAAAMSPPPAAQVPMGNEVQSLAPAPAPAAAVPPAEEEAAAADEAVAEEEVVAVADPETAIPLPAPPPVAADEDAASSDLTDAVMRWQRMTDALMTSAPPTPASAAVADAASAEEAVTDDEVAADTVSSSDDVTPINELD